MGNDVKNVHISLDTTVTTKELAIVLGLSTRRIQQLVQDGQFEAVKRGRFNLAKSVSRYIELFTKEQTDTDKEKLEAELSIKKAKAIVAVLEAKELQGKMHRSEDVAAMTEDLILTIRDALIPLPDMLAAEVSAVNESAEAAEIIRKKVYAVMDELTRYRFDTKRYAERIREHRNMD